MKLTTLFAAVPLLSCTLALAASDNGVQDRAQLDYDATVSDAKPVTLAGACRVNVLRVLDLRPNKEAISVDAPLASSSPEPWINQSLDTLRAYGFTVSHSKTAVADALNLDVRLIRAYTWYGSMRINGMVAIDVSNGQEGAPLEKYRAHGSKSNMAGMDSEHVTTLNFAVNNLIDNMAYTLQKRCATRNNAG